MATADDDDFISAGYDPSMVLGYDEGSAGDAAGMDLEAAVPRVLDGIEHDDEQVQAAAELDAVAQGFRDRMGKEAERLELATNSDYWFCVCFATQAQREAFLTAVHWTDLGVRYLDGREIAKRMGLDLPADPVWREPRRSSSWDDLSMTVAENLSEPVIDGR